MIKVIILVVLSIISGILYRCGGSGHYPRWIRPVGVCSSMVLSMWLLGYLNWILIPCFGLLFASLTTYFKEKGQDAKWWNWILVGLAISFSMVPFVILTGHWMGLRVRTLILTILIVIWSEANGNATIEEFGRGFFINATLPLLLINGG